MKNNHIRFKNRLRKHRLLMGYKQKDVAKLLGHKSTNRISRWEKGLSMPSVANLIKLSVQYHCLMNELYFECYKEFQSKRERML